MELLIGGIVVVLLIGLVSQFRKRANEPRGDHSDGYFHSTHDAGHSSSGGGWGGRDADFGHDGGDGGGGDGGGGDGGGGE